MPREGYQVPTAGAAARGSAHPGAASAAHDSRAVMTYLCGDCGNSVSLGKDALVACPHCAGRVLYKERTKRYVSSPARPSLFVTRVGDVGFSPPPPPLGSGPG